MAFGLFKKTKKSDIIIYNGIIMTQNPDLPAAEAAAIRDGLIIAVGDSDTMEELRDGETQMIDLCGRYVTPGLIDIYSNHAKKVFDGRFLDLSQCSDMENISEKVAAWSLDHPDEEMIFGYGYSERALCGEDPSSDFVTKFLDRGCQDRPVVLLCESSVSCILNSAASDIVRETAEEEMVQYVTTPYILGLFVPFDFEETQKAAKDLMAVSLAKGVTCCLGAGAPDYFDTLYQETLMSLHNEENLNQRFYSSYMMNRPLFPKGVIHRLMVRKTMCNEIDGLINSDICHVYLNASSCPVEFSFDSLKKILTEVADKGFSIYVTAVDSEDLDMAAGSLEYIRNKGYKNIFVIDSPHRIDTSDFVHWESAYYMPPREKIFSMSTEEFIRSLTAEAAQIIGADCCLGSIERGKRADMAVFDKDPLSMTPQEFWDYPAYMTIFNGIVV